MPRKSSNVSLGISYCLVIMSSNFMDKSTYGTLGFAMSEKVVKLLVTR